MSSTRRVCACGCRRSLAGRSERTRYFDDRCRQRAYRKRLTKAAKAAGVPASLSLRTLDSTNRTGERNGDAQTRPRKPQRRSRHGVSVYLPTVEDAEALKAALTAYRAMSPPRNLTAARDAVDRALERRRKRGA